MRYSLEEPKPLHLLTGEPTRCHWCTGLLKRQRNIYKGQNCERYYCSQKCLKDGEERAAQYANGRYSCSTLAPVSEADTQL